MLIPDQIVEVKWNRANKKYYIDKKYNFTEYNDVFLVKAEDLSNSSSNVIKVVCDYCGKEYSIPWYRYIKTKNKNQKCACYNCRSIKKAETTLATRQEKLYKKAMLAADNKGYVLLSKQEDVKNNITYIRYLCPKHGEHSMRIANFIQGKGCPDCVPGDNSVRFRLSPDEVEKRVQECGGKLLNKEDYINRAERNLLIECFECGKPFTTSLVLFTQHGGQVCNECRSVESMGEKRIRIFLEDNKIEFIFQKWFSDCRDTNPLPFDFYLPNSNTLIEFDGRQHFEETDHFTYPLEMVQKHDQIKNQYCIDNNIKLVRIPYWNIDKIEQILDEELILHEDIV